MEIEVIIPWRGGCPHRTRALDFTRSRYIWLTTVAECSTEAWSKGSAVNPAVECSSADIIVVADADCMTEGLPAAVEAVKGGAAFAVPHRKVYRLTEEGTALYKSLGVYPPPYDQKPYTGVEGGGFVVARRETLLDVPCDPRFIGWGSEDQSWALALHCLAGPAWRGDADLVHLYHPPQDRMSRRKGSPDNWRLLLRYAAARRKPDAMRSILKEFS